MHNHLIVFALLLLLSCNLFAQTNEDSEFIFDGYIFNEDSVPMENVHLINYRNTKIVTTNTKGYFKTFVKEGDSLMTNHISLSPKVIHAQRETSPKSKIYLSYQSYSIGLVSSTDFKKEKQRSISSQNILEDKNPLEFKVAVIFALLYVFFSFITQYTILNFGAGGLNILSYIVGVTDIDPFLLNLFQGKYDVSQVLIAMATLQAILSNNILKMFYAKALGNKQMGRYLLQGFGIIIIANTGIILFLHFIG